ncbi:MAG: glycosyltransferase family 2 protein [Desulfobulbaceae bacterium]|nr:glycosyltransferase family 2 protein [Desulfobulbaceae bacterium]HIJ79560.1 glycosyltransferase family 2 protein [Deltaproteobacteria bacterium]
MDLSIVIVNWNTRKLLLDCLASIHETIKEISYEIFLVDNASSDGSVAAVRSEYPEVKIIENVKNLGFAAANNKALRHMNGQYALLLNTDTVLTDGAIEKIHNYMVNHQDVAMACGQLLNEDGSKQNSVANFPSILSLLVNETLLRLLLPKRFPSKIMEYKNPIEVDSCIGACLMVRKKAMEMVGLLDERYFFFMEETDWALAMKKAGWRSCFVPDAKIYHLQGQSAGHNVKARIMFYRSRYSYFRKWFPNFSAILAAVVVLRLIVNFMLNLVGLVVTLGLRPDIRHRFVLYGRLLLWHGCGCP